MSQVGLVQCALFVLDIFLLMFLVTRGSRLGVGETSILSLGPVRSMAGVMWVVLLLKWKGKQMRKLKDMLEYSKKDTRN